MYRKILYPHSNTHPPRILHSTEHATLDPLLLDLISLICREHILTWYSNLSRDRERQFVQQVALTLIHVIQALEVRLAEAKLATATVDLVLLELPRILCDTYQTYDRTGGDEDILYRLRSRCGLVYDAGRIRADPLYLRTLVDQLLKSLLPPEDYSSSLERSIVREIVADLLSGVLLGRVCEPWYVHITLIRILRRNSHLETISSSEKKLDQSDASGVAAVPPISGESPHRVDNLPNLAAQYHLKPRESLEATTLHILRTVYLILSLPLSALFLLARNHILHVSDPAPLTASALALAAAVLPASLVLAQLHHLISLILAFCAPLNTLINQRLRTSMTAAMFGRLTPQELILAITRGLYPDGHPSPRIEEPSEAEKARLKAECETLLAARVPPTLAKLLGTDSLNLVQKAMRPFNSHGTNVVLVLTLLEMVVGLVFPELLDVA